jgi:hypothetical protein
VYLTTHYVESVLEEVFEGVEIMEVAVDDLCSTTKSTDDIQGLENGFCAGFWGFCIRGKRKRQPERERWHSGHRCLEKGLRRRGYAEEKEPLEAPVTRATR